MDKLICHKPAHFLSAQMAVQSSFFLVFLVLEMHNFDFGGEKFIPCHVPRDEMSSESLHAFGWHFTMVNFYRTVSGESQRFLEYGLYTNGLF